MAYKGVKQTKEHIVKRMKGSKKGWYKKGEHPSVETEFKKGNKPLFKGLTKETDSRLKKMSLAMKGNKRAWQGGKSFEPYSVDWTETLRRSIRERDNYICQLCSQYGNNVHHIDFDKNNCSPDNLVTLCRSCHCKQKIGG